MADDEPLLLNLATDGPDVAPAPRQKGFQREKKGTGRRNNTKHVHVHTSYARASFALRNLAG